MHHVLISLVSRPQGVLIAIGGRCSSRCAQCAECKKTTTNRCRFQVVVPAGSISYLEFCINFRFLIKYSSRKECVPPSYHASSSFDLAVETEHISFDLAVETNHIQQTCFRATLGTCIAYASDTFVASETATRCSFCHLIGAIRQNAGQGYPPKMLKGG